MTSFPVFQKIRLIAFLKQHLSWSNASLQAWLQRNSTFVNQRCITKNTWLSPGDEVSIKETIPNIKQFPLVSDENNLTILHHGQGLLAVEKPSGLPCHPLHPWEQNTVVQELLADYPDLRNVGKQRECGLLHRLDNETSGVLLFADSTTSHHHYFQCLQRQQWKKVYRAWVSGLYKGTTHIEKSIAHHASNKKKMVLCETTKSYRGRPQHAVSTITGLAYEANKTLVEVSIQTGVRHQIRIHLASLGYPILGDSLYGEKEDPIRLQLHCFRLSVPAIKGNGYIEIQSQETFEKNVESL